MSKPPITKQDDMTALDKWGAENEVLSPDEIAARLNSDKPKVELPGDNRLLSAFALDLADILKHKELYQRGGIACVVNKDRDGVEAINPQKLRTLAEEHLVCFRRRGTGGNELSLERTMSESDAKGVLCAQQFLSKLPSLDKIATARLPVMRSGGTMELLPTGYDGESRTLTLPVCDYEEDMELGAAKEIIDDLLKEFPFADAARSKSVAVSALVGLYADGLLPMAALRPVFIYLANAEGAGKTLLAKCGISPVHGRVRTDGDIKDKAEMTKELLTAVMEGRQYILFDNCKGYVSSSALEAFVTSPVWSGRILGVSQSFKGENHVTVFITGNGCTVSPDMRRRSLFVELFMEQERAEDRQFRRIMDDAALLDMRPQILAALWAFVRDWDCLGRLPPSRGHSSFPRWAEVIGGIVQVAGYGCPLDTAEIKGATDLDGADMRELVELLSEERLKFDDVVRLCRERGLFERVISAEGDLTPAEKSSLGKLFRRYDRRSFSGRYFVIEGRGHGRRFYVTVEAMHGEHGQQGVSAIPKMRGLPEQSKDHADHATVKHLDPMDDPAF
jgi:hypothetical protein